MSRKEEEKIIMDYGYVRVSSVSQNPDRQIREMLKKEIKRENIFVDRCSGKTFKRPEFERMIKLIKKEIRFILPVLTDSEEIIGKH